MANVEAATRALQELGLTEYEARCFVALARVSEDTAEEISQVAEVPRSRVYDTVERLNENGLVNVQNSEPRKYKAVQTDMAFDRFREDYSSRIEEAENALKQVEEPDAAADEEMWSISQSEHVTDRIVALVDDARDSIYHLVAPGSVTDDRFVDGLATATDRGMNVIVEAPSTEARREQFENGVPDAEVVVADGLETATDVYVERRVAVWTYGNDHGMAVWVCELLADRLPDDAAVKT